MQLLTKKQIRSLDRDISTLYNLNNYLVPKTIEDFESIVFFCSYFEKDKIKIYFNKSIVTALDGIVAICSGYEKLINLATEDDIYYVTKNIIQDYIFNKPKPGSIDFLEEIKSEIYKNVKSFTYICRVKGIKLEGIAEIDFGQYKLKKFDEELHSLKAVFSRNEEIFESIEEEYRDSIIITASESGTNSRSQKIFYDNAEQILSALLVYQGLLSNGQVRDVYLKLCNDSFGGFERASCIAYTTGESPAFTSYFKTKMKFFSTRKFLITLGKNVFLSIFQLLF